VEAFSVLVAATIAYVSFSGYRRAGSTTILLLGTAFLAQATLDTIHTLTYPGISNPFIQSGSNQAIYMWLSARISGSLLLLLSATLPEKEIGLKIRAKVLMVAIAAVTLLTTISTYAVKEFIDVLPPMFIPGKGLTMLKIGLEDFVAAALAGTALFYLRSYLKSANRTILMFTIGVAIFAFSEVGFMLYRDVYDIYNFLGHVFKLVAFLAFLSGLLLAK